MKKCDLCKCEVDDYAASVDITPEYEDGTLGKTITQNVCELCLAVKVLGIAEEDAKRMIKESAEIKEDKK